MPDCGTNAFTLITPIIHPADGANLLYQDRDGKTQEYKYQLGKCIAFSSKFSHSTGIAETQSRSVLLYMTFGTDQLVFWDSISGTAATQGKLHRLPNGNFCNNDFTN